MNFLDSIFRAYDIRGVYPNEIDENLVYILGKSFASILISQGKKTVAIGRDDRASSLSLQNSLASGLFSGGITVINTGITVEPAIHYFSFLDEIDASINVTASHNPDNYNGIKIDLKNAVPFYGEDLKKLKIIMEKGVFETLTGVYKEEDLNKQYIDFLGSKFKLKHPIRVVVYCGNGATSEIYPKVLEKIGAEVVPLRCYLDPEFPKGVPDPEAGKFYPELRAQIFESHAMLGVGFDGDGDRVGEMDEKGKSYNADEIFLLFCKNVLNTNPGGQILFDVKCSNNVEKYVKKYGGIPKRMPTGRAYFLNEMYEKNAILGCEFSGHFYFKDKYFGYDDGIYTACRLLEIMDNTGLKLSQLMNEFPASVATPELKYTVDDTKKIEIMENINKIVFAKYPTESIDKTDGVRVTLDNNSWFLIRSSNTSPYLSVRIESTSETEVQKILENVAKIIDSGISNHNV